MFNFCLISKRTTSSGQACLYCQPFRSLLSLFIGRSDCNEQTGLDILQDSLFRLATALEANNHLLGRIVRGTTGIGDCLMRLERLVQDAPTRRWYIKVLGACPNLQEVDISFASITELEATLQALHLLAPAMDPVSPPSHRAIGTRRLHNVVFNHSFSLAESENLLDVRQVFATLQGASVPSLDMVTFFNVCWNLASTASSIPLFPIACKHLRIETVKTPLAECIPLFPTPPSILETFSFRSLIIEAIDLTSLRTLVGVHLKKLGLKVMENPLVDDLTLSNYTTFTPRSTLILDNFVSFPLLTSLTLDNIHGPSLCFLKILAKALPLLRVIDLHHSRWISDSNSLSTIPDEIFPETLILSTLEEFKHVDQVDLGLLPTSTEERYQGLVKTLELRGVKVRFDCCVRDRWD